MIWENNDGRPSVQAMNIIINMHTAHCVADRPATTVNSRAYWFVRGAQLTLRLPVANPETI